MNCELLKILISNKGDTQVNLAKKLGLSKMSVNLKVNNKYPFTLPEVTKICKIYHISPAIMLDVFFDDIYNGEDCNCNTTVNG